MKPRHSWPSAPVAPLLVVLFLMLGLSGALAYQAWDAARSHRRVTEAALRDYAGFALWELRRRVESNAMFTLNAALMPAAAGGRGAENPAVAMVGQYGLEQPFDAPLVGRVRRGSSAGPELAQFAGSVEEALRPCGCVEAVSDFFILDPESLHAEVTGDRLGGEFRAWLTADFLEYTRASTGLIAFPRVQSRTTADGRVIALRGPPSDQQPAPVLFGANHAVVYASVQRSDSHQFYGFAIDVRGFATAMFADALSGPPLLPPSLTGLPPNRDLLSVVVWSANQDTVFRTGGLFPPGQTIRDSVRLATGLLTAALAVRPELAGNLLIGGAPRSRVPVLAGSLGLTVTLLVIALIQLQRQQELIQLRSDFVSGISHELRTPLAQIRLFSELLASERLEPEQRQRSMRILTDEAKRLTWLVENVLRFSKAERDTDRIRPRPVDLNGLLGDIADDFAPLAGSRQIRIAVECPAPLDAVLDPDAMRQVLLNLLDNAVKYGPAGQTVRVAAVRDADGLRIEVDDQGPGVPPADRDRIWEAYRRLARDIEAATGGSGIGLSVARELIDLHGGRIFVTDAPTGGARFVVLLPANPERATATTPPATPQPAGIVS